MLKTVRNRLKPSKYIIVIIKTQQHGQQQSAGMVNSVFECIATKMTYMYY